MILGGNMAMRIGVLFLYFMVFVGTYAGLYLSLASPSSVQDSREYGAGEGPDYFPVLVVDQRGDGTETLVLRSLARADYATTADAEERSWYLYRMPGEGRLTLADRVDFRVVSLPDQRQLVEVSIAEKNGQRTSIYAYEIRDNLVSPRSYRLLASFGNNFSPMPFTLLFTAMVIFLSEKFLVRRLRKAAV